MKYIAITGAASGIGLATADMLREDGYEVIGVDRNSSDITVDLGTDSGRKEAIAETLERCRGSLAGLVVAAGLGPYCEPADIVSVNYFGAVTMLEAMLPALEASGMGSAVAIASVAAQVPDFAGDLGVNPCIEHCLGNNEAEAIDTAGALDGMLAYIAAKRALALKARSLALPWGERSVRLNVICPGAIQTPMLDGVLAMDVAGDATRAQTVPLGRFAEPEEIAGPICFLLGPGASYVHGVSMIVDGAADALLRPDAV